ncbi:MAG: NAD(P)H-hydrate dehydratase [Clostridia bacterium]|nr:NAD(P)H-hydrate dehydratase [Clostridia bacterium]
MKEKLSKKQLEELGITCPLDGGVKIYSPRDIAEFYPVRPRNSHKGTFGSANLIAGSAQYAGAAALAVSAALKSGCGYVKITTANEVKTVLVPAFPQAIFFDKPDLSSNAIAVGMGCGATEELYSTVKFLLKNYNGVLIIDADGLNALSLFGKDILKEKNCRVILTPHAKEFSRLTGLTVGQITASPIETARKFASEYKVILLLKGAATVICDGSEKEIKTALNVRGSSALAKAGSGDMLAGYLCGTAARGLNPFDACVCATYTMGLAAELAAKRKTDYCATAQDILEKIHFAVKRLTTQNPSDRI